MKQTGKKVLLALLVLTVAVAVAACGDKKEQKESPNGQQVSTDAKAVVDKALGALQKGHYKEAQKYIPDLNVEALEDTKDPSNQFYAGLADLALKHMNYEITGVDKADGGSATVTVDVNNLDMTAMVEEFYTSMIDALLADPDSDGELSNKQMKEVLKSLSQSLEEKKKTVKKTLKIKVKDGKMTLDEKSLDVLLGGLLSVGEKLGD